MRTLVAGIGNIFCGDDGFGVAVVHQLEARDMPLGVCVLDAGTRALDLAYTLLDGWDLVVLVDAASRGKRAGSLTVLELSTRPASTPLLTHALRPEQVLATACAMGANLGRVVLVGCEPETLQPGTAGEQWWTLSPSVSAAISPAVRLVEQLIDGAVPLDAGGPASA